MSRSFYLGNDAELYTGAQSFSTKITASAVSFGLTSALATQLATYTSGYVSAYDAALDPETRTRGNVAAKNTAKDLLRRYIADLAKIIIGTPSVTDAQIIDLGLNVRAMPQSIPAPGVRPGIDLISVSGKSVTVGIHDSASSSKRGKPEGCVLAKVYSFIGSTYPEDPAEWTYEGDCTRNRFVVSFPAAAAGTQVWICAAWANAKAQAGPIAEPISAFLQYGIGAMAA